MSGIGKDEQVHEGGCQCGEIRFRTVGAPIKTTVCHCLMCQRTSGSAFAVEAIFLGKAVTFDHAPSIYTYRSPDHGRLLHYAFCPTCGTRLGVTLERFPKVQVINAGTYDNASWVKPDAHVFTRSAAPWVRLPDDVDWFSGDVMDEEGNPLQPLSRPR